MSPSALPSLGAAAPNTRLCYHARGGVGTLGSGPSRPCEHVRARAATAGACDRSGRAVTPFGSAEGPRRAGDPCLIATTCSSSAADRPARRRRTGSPSRGRRVLVVEKKRFPREKTCGDGLTPRAVRAARRHGPRRRARRLPALRRPAVDRARRDPRARLARPPRLPPVRLRRPPARARRDGRGPGGEGGRHRCGRRAEATDPLVEGGLVTGAIVHRKESGTREPVRARYVVVADGAQLAVRPRARHGAQPHVSAGHGRAGLLREPVPRRPLDREPPRPPRHARATTSPGTDGCSRSATAP